MKARMVGASLPKASARLARALLALPLLALGPAVKQLTNFAVDFRYPGNQANEEQAKTSLAIAKPCGRRSELWLAAKNPDGACDL